MSAAVPGGSVMRQTMDGQAEALAGILADEAPVMAVAERLRSRRVLAIGTGTSWYAASQAAMLLRVAGLDAGAAQSADAAVDGPLPGEGGALLVFTHTGAKRYTAQATQRARSSGAEIVQVSGVGVEGADLVTVPRERSSAYTASHLGALLRAAQLARALGAVALGRDDRLVCLDGGGAWSARIAEVAQAAEESGVPVTRVADGRLGEPLSIFPLTVAVQRIALEAAEKLGVNPDTFGLDRPGHQGWDRLEL